MPSFPFTVSVAASQKNLISALKKWKMHFSLDETKNLPPWHSSPPQGPHACPISHCFDKLCQKQGQTWLIWPKSHATSNIIDHFLKRLSGKLLFSMIEFFLTSRWYKMTPCEALVFFLFFELVTPDSRPAWIWQHTKLPLATRRCRVPL
jgi:hypothetical protein